MASCYRESEINAAAKRDCERLGLTFRDRQRIGIVKFVHGRDVFVSLPTGSGKSLCYDCAFSRAPLRWMFDQLRGAREKAQSISHHTNLVDGASCKLELQCVKV